MENENSSISFFQMPLHYPRYSKKDYQDMPEWMLDRLLAEYGLPATGNLAYKREFAMGAFLWPDVANDSRFIAKSSLFESLYEGRTLEKRRGSKKL